MRRQTTVPEFLNDTADYIEANGLDEEGVPGAMRAVRNGAMYSYVMRAGSALLKHVGAKDDVMQPVDQWALGQSPTKVAEALRGAAAAYVEPETRTVTLRVSLDHNVTRRLNSSTAKLREAQG